MAESLYLNKKKVDLYDKPVTRRLQIGEVSEVAERKSSFSYTIKLPKTSNNINLFDMLGTIGNTSRKPFEAVLVDYVVDGVFLVRNGSVVIRSTANDYQVNIIDGVRGLVDLLGDKKLSDLPLDDISHILTTQVYIDSYGHTDGFIYGVADYGQGTASIVKVEKQAPSIFTHTLFRRIFDSNGLNLQGGFFNSDSNYLLEVVTPSRGYDIEDNAFVSVSKGGSDSDLLTKNKFYNEYTTFEEKFTMSNLSLVGASIVGGNIVFSVAGLYKIDIDVLSTLADTYGNIEFRVNGVSKSLIYIEEGSGVTTLKSMTFSVEVNDVVSFWFIGSSGYSGIHEGYIIEYSISFDSLLFLETGGQLIEASDFIGEMKQIDFIKDVVNRYGLVLHPLQNTNEYIFAKLEDLLNDEENAEDWTSKLVEISGETYVSGYAKVNVAKYTYPEEIVVPNNDGEMLIDNENTNNDKTMFASSFEIPTEAATLFSHQLFNLPIWKIEDSVLTNEETPLKVLHVERFDDMTMTARLFTEVTGITVSSGVPVLNLESMSMQDFLDNYYSAFQAMVDDYRKVTAKLKLSVVDIYNLDFFRLKFLKQTGRFYYMNTVQNTTGKDSAVELIEIKEFTGH